MANAHPELAEAQDRFSRVKDSLLRCLDDRRHLRAELEQVRDDLLTLDGFCRGPGYYDFIDKYEPTRRVFENLKEDYHQSEEHLRRLEEATKRAEDDLHHLESKVKRKQSSSRPSTSHRYFYSSASREGRHDESSRGSHSDKHEDSSRGYHTRETRPDSDRSQGDRRGPTTHRYQYASSSSTHRGSSTESSHSSRSERYEDSNRGYYTRETKPDFASSGSSRSRRPSMPRASSSRHESRRHEKRHDYSDREHTNRSTHESSSRSRQPPRSTPDPSHSSTPNFPPSAQTVASWRKYVDDCFADYSKIKKFPHPPVVKDENWEHNLKTLLLCLDDYDLKKERLRWHPDRFSACPEDKQEEWKRLAKEIFVVMNEARKEREGEVR